MPRLRIRTPPGLGARLSVCLMCIAPWSLIAGCGTSLDEQEIDDLFVQGEYLCLEERWSEARTVLKEFLVHRPNHAGAHFYLGRAYHYSRPTLAEGELQTALELFIEDGRISTIERFGHDYFELICNLESAQVCLLQTDYLRSRGMPPSATASILERAARYVSAADAVMPGVKDVKILEDAIADYLASPRSRSIPKTTTPANI